MTDHLPLNFLYHKQNNGISCLVPNQSIQFIVNCITYGLFPEDNKMKLLKIILAFSLPLFLILGCKKSDDSSTSSTTSTTSTASCTADTTSTTLTASSSCLDGFYTHPKEADFTDFKISSQLPTCFTDEYARRKDMGDQYLQS